MLGRRLWIGFGWFLILITALQTGRYLLMNPEMYFPEQRPVYEVEQVGLILHVAGSLTGFLIGPFQFLPRLRARRPKLHRNLGKLYLLGVLIGSGAGLYMAQFAHGGFPAGLGFAFLAVLSLGAAGLAYVRVRNRDFVHHREWMIRSYALMFAAATLRVYLGLHGVLSGTGAIDLEFTQMYIAVAWICWVPNLIVAEWWIARTRGTPAAIPGTLSAA